MNATTSDATFLSTEIRRAAGLIEGRRRHLRANRALLVGLSGIDGAGKGHVAARLADALRRRGLRVGVLGADLFLRPGLAAAAAAVPAGDGEPGERFYQQALRTDELVERVLAPMRAGRSLRTTVRAVDATGTGLVPQGLEFGDIDVLLVEGILLLRRSLRAQWDVALWLECSFPTALERAIVRAQEGLPPSATRRAYEATFFPAQKLHLQRDDPRSFADDVLVNDPQLWAEAWAQAG